MRKMFVNNKMEEVTEEFVEDAPDPPVAPPAPVKIKLKERVKCQGCGREMSLHSMRYQHKCRTPPVGTVVPEPPPAVLEPPVEPPPEKKKVRIREAPVKQKALIQRTAEFAAAAPPPPPDPYMAMLQNRTQQAHLRQQAMLAPYAQMFASR